MELLYWQSLALLAVFTAALAIAFAGAVIFARQHAYRRGNS